jgi:hypothetical protein
MQSRVPETSELISQARELRTKTRETVKELNRTRAEIEETLRYMRWWRFLDYDSRALAFLENLDSPDHAQVTE